jgi:hypothetical protein
MQQKNSENKELPRQDEEKSQTPNQEQSDPPLTEIKGVTDPEEYVEPEVEEEPEE